MSWLMFSVRSVVGPVLLISRLRSLGFVAGRLPVRLVGRTQSRRRAPRLVLIEKVRWLRLRSTRHGRFRARVWYETNSMAVPKKDSEMLASFRGSPAQVIAACEPIKLALGSDGLQKIGEVLDAYFGVDGCEGLLLAVHELICGRRGHKPMLEYSMGVTEVVGQNQLQGVVIDQRAFCWKILIFLSTKKPWCWLPRTVMCCCLLFKLPCGICLLTRKVLGLSVWSQIRVMWLALPLEKAKTPIGRVGTKVVADVAGEVMAELPVFVAERPVTSLLIVGRRLRTKVARASPLLLMLRKSRRIRRIRWSPKTHPRNMGVPMLVCATWPTLVRMWALVVGRACSPSVS